MAHRRPHRPEHLAVGTRHERRTWCDGWVQRETDLPKVTGALLDAGCDHREVKGILSENVLRVLRHVEEHAA